MSKLGAPTSSIQKDLVETLTAPGFQSQQLPNGWLVWATDPNGTVSALTFVPK